LRVAVRRAKANNIMMCFMAFSSLLSCPGFGPLASGGVGLNWRGLLFGEARQFQINTYTSKTGMSVK
jgi:hypothetical protein